MSVLIVAAYPPELAELPSALTTRAIGIGLVEAAAGAERVLRELRPSAIVLIGTAGALPGAPLAIGDVAVARAARLVLRPGEYAPAPMPLTVDADAALTAQLARRLSAPQVTVASPMGITESEAEATRLAGHAALEQLECFALLSAAARAQVAASAIFAVANHVGPTAAAEWRTHRLAAEAAARAALVRALSLEV